MRSTDGGGGHLLPARAGKPTLFLYTTHFSIFRVPSVSRPTLINSSGAEHKSLSTTRSPDNSSSAAQTLNVARGGPETRRSFLSCSI